MVILFSHLAANAETLIPNGTNAANTTEWYWPSADDIAAPTKQSIHVQWTGGYLYFRAKSVTNGETTITVKTSQSYVRNAGSATLSLENGTTITVPEIMYVVNGGHTYLYTDTGSYLTSLGTHGTDLVDKLVTGYRDWLYGMQSRGYAWGVSNITFWFYLNGIESGNPEDIDITGTGGFPGTTTGGTDPGSTGSGTSSSTTTSTTSTVNGNVTQNNTTTSNYTYNYTYNTTNYNNTDGSGGGNPTIIEIEPIVTAIEENGEKIDNLTVHVDDGLELIHNDLTAINNNLNTSGPTGTNGLNAVTLPGGESAANSKFGNLASTMAINGQQAHTVTFAIPWVDGGSESFTLSSLPDAGSDLDLFRVILRHFMTVLIGLAFIFLTIKTLRYY